MVESNNNEIIDKMKESVIAKLDELDSSKKHDSTLIDYIIVMVVNQKSKFEMKHNLSLFLGKIVDEFVNWLFDYLATANELKTKSTTTNAVDKSSPKSASPQVKVTEKPVKTESTTESKVTTNGHSKEGTSKSESKKTTSKRKLKSAISIASTDDKDAEMTTPSIAYTGSSPSNTKSGKAKKRPVSESESYSAKKRSYSNENDNLKKKQSEKKNVKDEEMLGMDDASKENETKFLITLDGAKDMFKDNDGLFLDEDFDPELMNEDLSNFQNNIKNNSSTKNNNDASIKENNGGNSKSTERCKYWPACLNGTQCEFFHPVTKCNNFPYCRFGDKCLYIHPTCKYDSNCTRKDCNFMHTAKVRGPPMHQMYPSAPMMYGGGGLYGGAPMVTPNTICKYFPKCMNGTQCQFFHPKVCHYGPACNSFNCPFVHLPPQTAAVAVAAAPAVVPHTSKFKWSSAKAEAAAAAAAAESMHVKNEIES